MKSGKKRLMQLLMLCGLICIFMMPAQAAAKNAQSGRDSNGTSVTKTQNYEEFAKATAALVKANQGNCDARAASKNRFFAKRLIVKSNGKSLDFSKLNATAAVKGPNGLYVVQFASVAATENAMRTIESWSGIKYVEPDSLSHAGGEKTARVEGTIPENDLALNGEWSLGEDSQDEDTNSLMSGLAGFSDSLAAGNTALKDSVKFNSWGVEWIGADSYAKNVAARTSSSIKVAVVDSGVDQTHPFLESRVTSDGYDFVDVDSNPYDEFGHGTHVSGIIVDCTPGVKVKILPVRVLGADGNGWNSVISSGIYYAVERGAKVINMSLNGDCTQDEEDAIDYAVQKGVTVVVSAGNKNEDVVKTYNCPAHKKNVICVGAIDLRNVKADFSNYGSTLDVVAPGVGIYSCVPGGYYESWDGTSMATPHVAALAAMVKLVHPSYSPAQVEKTIKAHCKDLGPKGYDVKYGYGVPQFASVDRVIDVKSVTLNKTSVTVKAGQKYTLKATVSPSDATNKTITWRSANPSVATVSGGVVTAKKAGIATITAKSANGKQATCKVKVTSAAKPAAPILTHGSMNRDGKLSLGWNAVNGASGYRVNYYNYGTGTTSTKYLSGKTNTEWTITLNKNVLYRISVCAYRIESGARVYGATRLAYASAPRIIQGANATSTAITLKWAKLKGINGYYIYRSASRDSGYTRLARLSENAVSYRVTGLGAEKTYIRVVPYKLVNGKAVTLPHEITTLSR